MSDSDEIMSEEDALDAVVSQIGDWHENKRKAMKHLGRLRGRLELLMRLPRRSAAFRKWARRTVALCDELSDRLERGFERE